MEVPHYWREMPTSTSFSGKAKGGSEEVPSRFKFPGGEIGLFGTYEEIYSRFEERGFKADVIEEILFYLFGSVASETSISLEKIINSQNKLVGSEVRK